MDTLICASGTLFRMWAAARATSLAKARTSPGCCLKYASISLPTRKYFTRPSSLRKNGVEQTIQPYAHFLAIERLIHQIRRNGPLIGIDDADM